MLSTSSAEVKWNPGRGSGRRGGGASGGGGCGCSDVSDFSTRVSSGTHTTTADVSIGYLTADGVTHFASPKNEKKKKLNKRRDTRRQRISRYACVLARSIACVCVRPCRAGAVTNHNNNIII